MSRCGNNERSGTRSKDIFSPFRMQNFRIVNSGECDEPLFFCSENSEKRRFDLSQVVRDAAAREPEFLLARIGSRFVLIKRWNEKFHKRKSVYWSWEFRGISCSGGRWNSLGEFAIFVWNLNLRCWRCH